jgi:hypothetical protein
MTNSSVLAHPLCDKLWCVVTIVSGIMLRRRREQPYFSRVPSLEHNAKRHQLDTGTVGTVAHGAANGRHRQPPVLVLSSSFVESRTRLGLIAWNPQPDRASSMTAATSYDVTQSRSTRRRRRPRDQLIILFFSSTISSTLLSSIVDRSRKFFLITSITPIFIWLEKARRGRLVSDCDTPV